MISFVIPAKNESNYLGNTLQTIIALMGDTDEYEIIVVDNASTDNTLTVAQQFDSDLITVISLERQVSISKARNLGVASSKGEILVFLDADILITELWVRGLLEFLELANATSSLISGHRVAIAKTPCLIELTWFNNLKTPANPNYINSGNLVTTRVLFDTVKGFDECLTTGEDVDFCLRAMSKGAKIVTNKNFFAHHEGYPKTISQFMRREQWHGIGDVQSWDKFCRSKVAIFSWVMILLLCISFTLLLSGEVLFSLPLLTLFVVINGWIVKRRFNINNFANYSFIFSLHMAYMLARCSSIFAKRAQRAR